MTMLRHAVIVVSLTGGPEHRRPGAGHQRQIARSSPSPMPDPIRLPRSAGSCKRSAPDREEPPDAPRFRHARRPDPLGVEPGLSLGRTADLFRSNVTALGLAARRGMPSAPSSTHPQEVFITAIRLIVSRNLPVPISPQGVRRAPHGRQQVILCTWPLSFGNLASASWQ